MRYGKFVIFPGDDRFEVRGEPVRPRPARGWFPLILFFVTVFTTTAVGALMEGRDPLGSLAGFASGFPFSVTLLGILGVHEFAHYLAAKRWGIDVSLPYFIPAPSTIGTFGAVIRMRSAIPNRRALVDVGVSGPLAGFVLAVAASVIGLAMSPVAPVQTVSSGALTLGDSLLFKLLGYLVAGPVPPGYDVVLTPVAFAGWIGLFVTALNLMPFGQLDGGHVLFALSPGIHDLLRRIRIPLLLLLGFTLWSGWYVWAVLLFFLGGGHPYPDVMETRLGPLRTALAVFSLVVFVLCVIPSPVRG